MYYTFGLKNNIILSSFEKMMPSYQHVLQEEPNSSCTYRQHGIQQEFDDLRRHFYYPMSVSTPTFNYEYYNRLPYFQYFSQKMFNHQEHCQKLWTPYSPFGSLSSANGGKI